MKALNIEVCLDSYEGGVAGDALQDQSLILPAVGPLVLGGASGLDCDVLIDEPTISGVILLPLQFQLIHLVCGI